MVCQSHRGPVIRHVVILDKEKQSKLSNLIRGSNMRWQMVGCGVCPDIQRDKRKSHDPFSLQCHEFFSRVGAKQYSVSRS